MLSKKPPRFDEGAFFVLCLVSCTQGFVFLAAKNLDTACAVL